MAIAVLVILLMPTVYVTRTPSRRIQCANNLKQIGLGIHNFHDTFAGLPPLALDDSRASMFVFLTPFCEAQNVYNLYSGGNQNANTNIANVIDGSSVQPLTSWNALTPLERDAASSLRWLSCPTRRSGIQQIAGGGTANLYAGPTGDYAVVYLDQNPNPSFPFDYPAADVSPKTGWQWHQNPCDPAEVKRQKGAIRLALIECPAGEEPNYGSWKSRDTFAWITDGLSNSLVVGEKHIREGEVGKYSASQDDQDGVFTFTSRSGGRNFNVARNLGLPLANGQKDARFSRGQIPAKGPQADFGFGSWHSGVVQFLRADGSVATMSTASDPQTLRRLGHAGDGLKMEASESLRSVDP
jgi:hypothetical protein